MKQFDIIGDIHGCYDEMNELLVRLGYKIGSDLSHRNGRIPVFLGDLTDRGPSSLAVIEDVCRWVKNNHALYCPGNHCNKLYRYFLGRNVMIKHGLETTVEELNHLSSSDFRRISHSFIELYEQAELYLQLDNNQLVVAHAGIRPDLIGSKGKRVKSFVLYGDITGETHGDGRPVRRDWASKHSFPAFIVYGHTPVADPRWIGDTVNIDTGCVFGGQLTALQWPEKTTLSVPSNQPYVEDKFQSFN
ncbi:bis(5'-nucleosyl)-tetraphosphatase PrpE [Salipaludibacillus daqingensis]|uniref:bis(5'-nucleosyl)-tetraphosphatase PrpE n=1 Tax=Salipaludibacillus daqingensis TaxID=3041001 RepID=UPI002476881E|nr:bis(5'-nucleosyl)-tetraphosphatase PrpE [Salipaludibacillus daqingensis]